MLYDRGATGAVVAMVTGLAEATGAGVALGLVTTTTAAGVADWVAPVLNPWVARAREVAALVMTTGLAVGAAVVEVANARPTGLVNPCDRDEDDETMTVGALVVLVGWLAASRETLTLTLIGVAAAGWLTVEPVVI